MTAPRKEVLAEGVELWLGDCRDVLPQIPAVDLMLTDPPYGVGLNYPSHDDGNIEQYQKLMREFMAHRMRWSVAAVTTGMKHHVWWYSEFKPTYTISWIKPNQCSNSPLGGFNVWEPILLWGKPKKRIPHDSFTRAIETAQKDTGDHPCHKDPRAWQFIIEMLTNENDTVLDPFMGTGTGGVGCVNLGRKFIGIEIEPKYFDTSCKRIDAALSQPFLFTDKPERL